MAKQDEDLSEELKGELLRVLGHSMRQRIVRLMLQHDPAEIGPRDAAAQVSEALSNVAYHFRILEKAKAIVLVRSERVGGSTASFYRLSPPLRRLPWLEAMVGSRSATV